MSSAGTTTIAMQGLLDRVAQGDERAKKDLINLAYERLLIIARKLLGSFVTVRLEEETAGVLAEAYLRLHRSLDEVKPESVRQFMGLAALKIRQVLLDKIRELRGGRGKVKRPERVSLQAGGDSQPGFDVADPDYNDVRQDRAIDLLEAISMLPDEEREAVELLYFSGYSQPEAGVILGVHEDTVKRRWTKARMKLADKLSPFA